MSIFDNIVVAWNYTYPHYDSIPFLAEFYGFPNVIHYGPPGDDSRVVGIETNHGFTSYAIFEDAFKRFPNTSGVMLVHDDFLLNRKQFENLNIHKIWSQPWRNPDSINDWYWWKTDVGAAALERVMPLKNVFFGYSDLMYVPTAMAKQLVPQFAVHAANKVFCELAWPNIINTNVKCENIQFLHTINHVQHEHGHYNWRQLYKPEYHGIHPVKWSIESNKRRANKLKNFVPH